VAANEYLRERHPEALRDPKLRKHFHNAMFHGFDFDHTMLRIGSMNMLLHGIENPDIVYRGTDHVWFYDVDADGWSLDDKRTPLLLEDKLGPNPADRAERRRAREEQPTRHRRAMACEGKVRAQAGANRAEFLRGEGRPRLSGIRPLLESLS